MSVAESETYRWWHLPSFLGLDAPCVVAGWMWLLLRGFQKPVEWPVLAAAFLTVWSIYLLDRLIDVRFCRDWSRATARLRFGRRYRRLFAGLLLLSSGSCAVLWVRQLIPGEVIVRAIAVGIGVAAYVILFVLVPTLFRRAIPGKEPAVGLFFGLGIFAATGPAGGIFPVIFLFVLLAAFNCLVISSRDREADAANDPAGASRWWNSIHRDLAVAGIVLAGLAGAATVFLDPKVSFAGIALAFAAMTALHRFAPRLSPADVRALADICLLAPLPIGFFA